MYVLALCATPATGYTHLMGNHVEVAEMWQARAFGGLELLRASFDSFRFTPHIHEEYMLVVTEAGAAKVHTLGRVQLVEPGSVIILNPNVVHGGGPTGTATWRYRAFYPSAELMQRATRGIINGLPRFASGVVRDPQLAARLLAAHHTLEGSHSELARESMLLDALSDLVSRHADGGDAEKTVGGEHYAVRVAREYLDAQPAQNISLDELAGVAGVSPFHLSRVFRRETGLSPHAYQIVVRARHAKTLLGQGLPIAQVAVAAGFFDQAHLTRHFKRIYGVTPGRYLA